MPAFREFPAIVENTPVDLAGAEPEQASYW